MAIERRWINWATASTGAVLLLFTLAQLVVTFYMNLTAVINAEDKKNVSGAMMVSMGVLIFPTAWVAFAAAISRHRGVYIALIVLVSLALLDSAGMMIYQTYTFSNNDGYTDEEKAISITMVVLQSLQLVILIFQLAFGTTALCYQSDYNKRSDKRMDMYGAYGGGYTNYYAQPPPVYNAADGYKLSLPRGAWDYATEPRPYYGKARY